MKKRTIDFNETIFSFLKKRAELSGIALDSKIAVHRNAFAFMESKAFSGGPVDRICFSNLKIAGAADASMCIVYPQAGFHSPVFFAEKIDFVNLSRVLIDIYPSFFANGSEQRINELRDIYNELSILPGMNFDNGAGGKEPLSPYCFSSLFAHRYHFSTGVAVRRYLSWWFESISKHQHNVAVREEKERDYINEFKRLYSASGSSIVLKLVGILFGKKWKNLYLSNFLL